MLGDGERLPPSNVKLTVELDEIYRIFDEPTRKDFSGWVKEGSVAVADDYAEDLNDAIGNLAPFATDGARLLEILDDQKGAVRGVVRDTGRVFNALAAEEGQLSGLIENGNETFDALASRDDALADTFQVFPTFLRETRSTLARLETFARDTRPLVNDLKGPADDLGPTVRDLGDLAPDLQQLYRDLDPLIDAANRGLPQGERFLAGSQPVFKALHNFLPELNPVLAYLSFSRQQVAQFITVGGAALAGNGTGGYQQPARRRALAAPDRADRRPVLRPQHQPAVHRPRQLLRAAQRLPALDPARRDREHGLPQRRAARPQGHARRRGRSPSLNAGVRAALLRGAALALPEPEVRAPAARTGTGGARARRAAAGREPATP